jgi:hypothetical protein
MNVEAKIISKHNLDCSTIENLASDIAIRLGYNIEYGQYQKEDGNHHFNVLGAVTVKENGIVATLYDLRNDEISDYNFVFEIGEVANVIYEEFIEFMPPWEEQYKTALNQFNNGGFSNDSFYAGIFNELQKLGADKVYFIKDTFTPELAITKNTTLESYLEIIQKETAYFEVPLINN